MNIELCSERVGCRLCRKEAHRPIVRNGVITADCRPNRYTLESLSGPSDTKSDHDERSSGKVMSNAYANECFGGLAIVYKDTLGAGVNTTYAYVARARCSRGCSAIGCGYETLLHVYT